MCFLTNQLTPARTQRNWISGAHHLLERCRSCAQNPSDFKGKKQVRTVTQKAAFLPYSHLSVVFPLVLGVRAPFNLHAILVWITCLYQLCTLIPTLGPAYTVLQLAPSYSSLPNQLNLFEPDQLQPSCTKAKKNQSRALPSSAKPCFKEHCESEQSRGRISPGADIRVQQGKKVDKAERLGVVQMHLLC